MQILCKLLRLFKSTIESIYKLFNKVIYMKLTLLTPEVDVVVVDGFGGVNVGMRIAPSP